ncbi:MAG: flagellar hook-basal body complex protein FliE [Gaiellaceae bacterium]
MPVDPVTSVGGGASIGELGGQVAGGGDSRAADGFGDMLAGQIQNLENVQQEANQKALELATGQSDDVAGVVMAVEKATLTMQLAAQIRNRGVEAYQEIWRLQV